MRELLILLIHVLVTAAKLLRPGGVRTVVAESLLDRLINTSHQVFMNGPSYRPNKRPGRVLPTGNTNAS